MTSADYNIYPITPILDVVRLVSLSGNKVLLVQESDDPNWKLPGGKTHAGETVFEAAQRELLEELGLNLTTQMITTYRAAPIPNSDHIRHIFLLDEVKPTDIIQTTEVAQAGYFSLTSLPPTKFQGHITSAVRIITG